MKERNAALEKELNKARGKIDELTPKKPKWNDTTKKTSKKHERDDDDEDEDAGGGTKKMSKREAKKAKFAKNANKFK